MRPPPRALLHAWLPPASHAPCDEPFAPVLVPPGDGLRRKASYPPTGVFGSSQLSGRKAETLPGRCPPHPVPAPRGAGPGAAPWVHGVSGEGRTRSHPAARQIVRAVPRRLPGTPSRLRPAYGCVAVSGAPSSRPPERGSTFYSAGNAVNLCMICGLVPFSRGSSKDGTTGCGPQHGSSRRDAQESIDNLVEGILHDPARP